MGADRGRRRRAVTGWVRLFYRNNTQAVFREGRDLDRALARKVPGIIHREDAIIHRCAQCQTDGPWTDEWIGIPRYDPATQRLDFFASDKVFCSEKCKADHFGDEKVVSFRKREPNRDQARKDAWSDAYLSERDRKTDLIAHRRVPLPPHQGRGWCRWCALAITSGRRYNWHDECLRQFLLHSDLNAQLRFLRDRDGRTCAMEGCGNPGAEVDHRIPLYSIRDLPDWARVPYYGPRNIWLLCYDCHKAKSAREAAQRAAQRREGNQAPIADLFPE